MNDVDQVCMWTDPASAKESASEEVWQTTTFACQFNVNCYLKDLSNIITTEMALWENQLWQIPLGKAMVNPYVLIS